MEQGNLDNAIDPAAVQPAAGQRNKVARHGEQIVTSDGVTIHYTVDDLTRPWTKPQTVVMLHAAFGTMNRFRAWVPHVAGRYRVVRWDMRGHGDSDLPADDLELSIERLSKDYIELLDHLGVEKAHLVGSSTGGIIGMHAAVEHPERILSLSSYAAIPGLGAFHPAQRLQRLGKRSREGRRARFPAAHHQAALPRGPRRSGIRRLVHRGVGAQRSALPLRASCT